MTVLLDTDLLPQRERLDALQAAYTSGFPQRVTSLGDARVVHRIELVDLGPDVVVRRVVGSPFRITREPRHVRQDAPEFVSLSLHREGDPLLRTAGTERQPRLGHLDCNDATRPYDFVERGRSRGDLLVVSNQRAGVSVDTVRAALPVLARSPVYELVRRHVAGLFDASSELPAGPRMLTGQASVALMRTLLLTAAGDARARDALHDTLEVRIAAYIETYLGDRDLSPERIAAAHNVSVRHLYNVWTRAGHDVRLTQWILDRRLRCAAQEIAVLDPHRTSVASVARRWGFADASHFGRRFREAFGASPREWCKANRSVRGGRR